MLPLDRTTRSRKRGKEDALTMCMLSLLETPEDDPLDEPETAFGDLDEGRYKAELELVDRYQTFVAELLRLSLLGIAVFGYLYKITF
jgi:hypothetical protein